LGFAAPPASIRVHQLQRHPSLPASRAVLRRHLHLPLSSRADHQRPSPSSRISLRNALPWPPSRSRRTERSKRSFPLHRPSPPLAVNKRPQLHCLHRQAWPKRRRRGWSHLWTVRTHPHRPPPHANTGGKGCDPPPHPPFHPSASDADTGIIAGCVTLHTRTLPACGKKNHRPKRDGQPCHHERTR
jgi:hypothetical protein